MFLPNTHHVFTQYTVKYVMKPVEYMAGENLTENRGKSRPHPIPPMKSACVRSGKMRAAGGAGCALGWYRPSAGVPGA